jgi:hypothetical protein
MITTTLAVIALASGLDLSVSPSTPSWQKDYAQAMSRASAERKPIAVFIGHGNDKIKQMLADGAIPADAAKLLSNSYVCLYLNTDTAEGKALAGQFEITEGLVISGPGGSTQAYRHAGSVAGADLTKQLTQYATAGQPTTTVSGGALAPVRSLNAPVIVSGGYTGGNYGTVVPASGQFIYPGASFPAAGYPFGAGCTTGR